MKYKGFTVSDVEVEKIVDKLGVSMFEACDMILTDKGVISNEKVEEMTEKAKENRITTTIHEAKGKKKTQKQRVKKENPLKKEIINAISNGLCENLPAETDFYIRNDEKYIDFTIAGRDFTINLVEHRQKKTK